MWFRVFFLCIQYIIYNQNALSNANPMVGNFKTVPNGQYTFVVSIKIKSDDYPIPETFHGSSATLITRKHVLTVEHTFHRLTLDKLEVIVGSNDIRSGTSYEISDAKSYTDWARANRVPLEHDDHDLIVVTLHDKVPDHIQPVELSPLDEDSLIGMTVKVIGWGLGDDNNISRFLREALVQIMTRQDCKNRIETFTGEVTNIHLTHLCTSANPFVILRRGDSGGPVLLTTGQLVAVSRATCPSPEYNLHPQKINCHIGINYYRNFINSFRE